jgi:hypothetical protein
MNSYFAEYRIAREIEKQKQQLDAKQFNVWLAWLFKLIGDVR